MMHAPKTLEEASALIKRGQKLHLIGGDTRAGLGNAVTGEPVTTRALTGVTLYKPSEMVIRAKAGTPLNEIESLLATHKQRLPFEPFRLNRLYGTQGDSTLGGVAATNASGSRRLYAGACRDAMIGITALNGHGETFKSGGRVMKDVTGYDLVKTLAGSHGTLALIVEVAFKLLPVPETEITLCWHALDDRQAVALMTEAIGSPFEVTGAAHVNGQTLLRLEGFADSVAYRARALQQRFARFGQVETLSSAPWRDIAEGIPLAPWQGALWRITTAPTRAPDLVAALQPEGWYYDWAGGQIWVAMADDVATAGRVRARAKEHKANATLMRAAAETFATTSAFQPPAPELARLNARLKAAFDPKGLFNTGRMGAEFFGGDA